MGHIFEYLIIYYLFCRYSIHDLKGEKKYMLNMKMKVCVQKGGGSCLFTKTLFQNTKVPKVGCDWSNTEFKIKGKQIIYLCIFIIGPLTFRNLSPKTERLSKVNAAYS